MEELVPQPPLDELKLLTKAIWGNPRAILKRDNRTGLEYIDLSEHVGAFGVLGLKPKYEKVLVRQEYRDALQALKEDVVYEDGAYVTGHPGIGKSLFLVYILVTRLGNQEAVAWQVETSGYVLLNETASFYSVLNGIPLRKIPVWALSDSTHDAMQPLSIFYYTQGSIKTIQTTSPRQVRWKQWSKYAGAECYVMDIWCADEIADLARLLNLDVERMGFLAEKWGGVPRRLLKYLNDSDEMIEQSYKGSADESVTKCKEALPAIEANNYPDEAPALFYFCRPRRLPELGDIRMFSRAFVPTRTLHTLLAEALQRRSNLTRLTFFSTLAQYPGTRSAAGFVFENWTHSFFLASKTIECHWLQGRQGVLSLQGTDILIPTSWSDVNVAQPPYYWIAPTGFPGIDCALVFQTEIYAIQLTLRSKHPSPINGLLKLRENLPEDLRDLPWSVLFVGHDDSLARTVAKQWLGRVPFPSKQAPLTIGWSALDPVVQNIPWKEYRSQPESQHNEDTEEMMTEVD